MHIAWTKGDKFIMESFISKGYTGKILKVLNNVRIYMKVVVLSNITKDDGKPMASWTLRSEINKCYSWDRPSRRVPKFQNL